MQLIIIIVLQMIIILIYFCPTINCLTILQAIQYRGYRGDGGSLPILQAPNILRTSFYFTIGGSYMLNLYYMGFLGES